MNKNDSVKWIVLGVVVLTFIFIFKDELARFLDRTQKLKVSKEGFEVQTLLGETEVPIVRLEGTEVHEEGIQGSTYVSHQDKFQISWPSGNDWNANETMGKSILQQQGLDSRTELSMPLVILKKESINNFRPNVNVVVEIIGSMSIIDYMNRTVQEFQQLGWQILTWNVDENTQGGFISIIHNSQDYKLFQFQRIAIADGKAYIITASQLPPENSLSQQLRKDLLSILNSFKTIV
jgi:hypothetical protein